MLRIASLPENLLKEVLKIGSYRSNKYFTFKWQQQRDCQCFRLAIVVSKKVYPKAVDRNRLKRIIKSWAQNNLRQKINMVIITKPPIVSLTSKEIRKELHILAEGCGLLLDTHDSKNN
jgi:ribonuclease P protein component